MSELTVLQAVRLKGRVITTDLAQTLGEDLADVAATVDRLTAAGLLVDATPLRISPSGRMRLDDLLAEERNRADSTVLAAAYRDFRSVNADFKRLVTDWQLKGEKPNTHDDAEYDAAVLSRLDGVHRRVGPIIGTEAAHENAKALMIMRKQLPNRLKSGLNTQRLQLNGKYK
ncbi:hypothetical protein ABLN85_05880, partial [Mycobacterium tuberculosis]